MGNLPKTWRGAFVLCALLALAAAPASATDWYIYLELGSIEPGNASLIGAGIEESDTSGSLDIDDVTLLEAEPGSEFTGRLAFGVGVGGGVVGLSYWRYSGDDTVSANLFDGLDNDREVQDSMAGEIFNVDDGKATVFGEIEADIIDLAYYVSKKHDKIRTGYHFGISILNYEETIRLDAVDADDSSNFLEEEYRLEAEGVGLMFGGSVEYQIGDHFALYGNASARFVMSDTDESLVSLQADDDDLDRFRDERDGAGLVWDLAAGVVVYRTEKVRIGLEYQFSSWNDMVQRLQNGDDLDDPHLGARSNVTFHGFAATALFKFGGDA